jgi:anti-anti-sigma regulatory factor
MESFKLKVVRNGTGQVEMLDFSGLLVVSNSQQIHKELVSVCDDMNSNLTITIEDVEDIDLSFVQLIVAFTRKMTENQIKFRINWNLDAASQLLLKNAGFKNDLFML